MAKNEWVYDDVYKNWFYLKSDGSYANQDGTLLEVNGTILRNGAI